VKRLAAVVVAVGMVLGAVYVRDRIDGEGGGGGGDELRLRCSTELREVCDELAEGRDEVVVQVEDPGTTADDLVELSAGEDPGFDFWLADASWPAVVTDTRDFRNADGDVVGEPSDRLARSPVVLAVRTRTPGQVVDACGDEVEWRCIGTAVRAGAPLGLPSPDRGDGLAVLAAAAAGFFDRADYATNDLRDDADFSTWFDAISAPVRGPGLGDLTPLEAGVTTQGRFAMVGALEANIVDLARSREVYDAIYPEPVVTSDLVLVPAQGSSAGAALDRLGGEQRVGEVLAEAGWRVPDAALPDGANPDVQLPERQGTPSPGVLHALRDRWKD
jgi:hypothetical protein